MEEQLKPNIKITDLNVTYNKGKTNEIRALENINLEINPREYVIIFGPSGCGKSTLLHVIAGLQRPTSGGVEVESEDIGKYGEEKMVAYHREKIGMIFQAFYLIPSLNVADNVCLPKIFEESEEGARLRKAAGLLERFSIEEQAKKFPGELSGGQKQRVSIARSLINDPEIILADEPVGNLDSKSAHNVMSILEELNEKDKKTVILVTHDPAHLDYGSKIVHMKDGKITKVEIVKKRKRLIDSYIFKDGKLNENLEKMGLTKEEFVSPDLNLLMRSFRNLTFEQIGSLMVPFKVQQLFSYIFFSITEEQINFAKQCLQDFIFGKIDAEEMVEKLNKDEKEGGAGWDKRNAQKFSLEAMAMLREADKIDFSDVGLSSTRLSDYLVSVSGSISPEKKTNLAKVVADRLKNKIGFDELSKIIDMPENKGGLGLDRRTARKIARAIELILLLRYSA